MFADFFATRLKKKKLTNRLTMLEAKKEMILTQLSKQKKGDQSNIRRSDRKFKENRGKALSARAKRANKAALLDINRQIKFTQTKLNQLVDKKLKTG